MFSIFIAPLLIPSIDPSLGKVEKASLPQQTLMELFIEKVTVGKTKIVGFSETPTPITEWNGIDIKKFRPTHFSVTFHSSGDVTVITFNRLFLEGSIQLEWLPLTTTTCNLNWNRLDGTVNLKDLPDTLISLDLMYNDFSGSVDLTSLLSGIEGLYLSHNPFSGVTDFRCLPRSLRHLDVSRTSLTGTVPVSLLDRVVIESCGVESAH